MNTPELTAFNEWQNKAKYTEEELHQIYHPGTPVKGVIKPIQMSTTNRILHYAYSRVMVNKAGNFTQLMDLDNPVLAMLIQKLPINPGQLICEELLRFSKSTSKKTPLPFPQLISFILATNMIWYLEEKGNVSPPRLDLRTIKKMGIPIPVHVPEGSTAERAPEQNTESDGETSSSTPSVPQPTQPASAKIHISDAVVEAIAAKVAANLEPTFKTIFEGMERLANMNTVLHSKVDGLASLFKSYLDPSMSTSPPHPFHTDQPSNLSPPHFPHTSPIPSPHPTQTSPPHTSPIPSHKSPSASPIHTQPPSPHISPKSHKSSLPPSSPSSHPPSPPSPPILTTKPAEPASSPPHISPSTFAQTYARKGKAPIIASPEPLASTVDDDKKGEKRHSVPTEGESSAVQELASKAASILASIAAEDETTATLSQILPEIHQVAEGIREKSAEEVLIEDVSDEEPESEYFNIPPEDPREVLEETDMSWAMVLYEEPQPVSVDTFPHLRRSVAELIERLEAEDKAREEREKAKAERDAAERVAAERAAEAEAQAKAEQEKKSKDSPKPVIPSWGLQKKVTFQKRAKTQDQAQTTSEFLASGGEEEKGPEVQSTKRLRVKMTAPRPPPREIAVKPSKATKGVVIKEPKPAPKSVSKAAPKRKAAPKGKASKPPPRKKQKQPTKLDRLLAYFPPSSPKKKKTPAKKAPARKKKAEPEPVSEEDEENLMDPSISSGGYSYESGDDELVSKFASSASDSD